MQAVTEEQLKKQGEWKEIILDLDQKLALAKSAAQVKWDKNCVFIQQSHRLLRPRKAKARSHDLWTIYSVIRENILNGGVRYFITTTYSSRKTRPVKSEFEISRISKALWNLTERFADIAKLSEWN